MPEHEQKTLREILNNNGINETLAVLAAVLREEDDQTSAVIAEDLARIAEKVEPI